MMYNKKLLSSINNLVTLVIITQFVVLTCLVLLPTTTRAATLEKNGADIIGKDSIEIESNSSEESIINETALVNVNETDAIENSSGSKEKQEFSKSKRKKEEAVKKSKETKVETKEETSESESNESDVKLIAGDKRSDNLSGEVDKYKEQLKRNERESDKNIITQQPFSSDLNQTNQYVSNNLVVNNVDHDSFITSTSPISSSTTTTARSIKKLELVNWKNTPNKTAETTPTVLSKLTDLIMRTTTTTNNIEELVENRTPKTMRSSTLGNGIEKRGKLMYENATNIQQMSLPESSPVWSLVGMLPQQQQQQNDKNNQSEFIETITAQSEKNLLDWKQIMLNTDMAGATTTPTTTLFTTEKTTNAADNITIEIITKPSQELFSTPNIQDKSMPLSSDATTTSTTTTTIRTPTTITAKKFVEKNTLRKGTGAENATSAAALESETTTTTTTTRTTIISPVLNESISFMRAKLINNTAIQVENNESNLSDIITTTTTTTAAKSVENVLNEHKWQTLEETNSTYTTTMANLKDDQINNKRNNDDNNNNNNSSSVSTQLTNEQTKDTLAEVEVSSETTTMFSIETASEVGRRFVESSPNTNTTTTTNNTIITEEIPNKLVTTINSAVQNETFDNNVVKQLEQVEEKEEEEAEKNLNKNLIVNNTKHNNKIVINQALTTPTIIAVTTTEKAIEIIERNINQTTEIQQIANERKLDIENVDTTTINATADLETTTTTTTVVEGIEIETTTIAAATTIRRKESEILSEILKPISEAANTDNKTVLVDKTTPRQVVIATIKPLPSTIKTTTIATTETVKNESAVQIGKVNEERQVENEGSIDANVIDPPIETLSTTTTTTTTTTKPTLITTVSTETVVKATVDSMQQEKVLTDIALEEIAQNSLDTTTAAATTTTSTTTTTTTTTIAAATSTSPPTSTTTELTLIIDIDNKNLTTTTADAITTMLPQLNGTTTTNLLNSTTTTLPDFNTLGIDTFDNDNNAILATSIAGMGDGLRPKPDDSTDVNVIIAIVVSVIGVVALILLVGFLYLIRKRQKQMSYAQRCHPATSDAYSLDNVSVFGSLRRKGAAARTSKRIYGNAAFDDPSLRHHILTANELGKFVERRSSIFEEFRDVPEVTARADEVPAGCEDKNR